MISLGYCLLFDRYVIHQNHKGTIVFGGITIGNNMEIGANAVVNKPVLDNVVVAGVPTRVLRIKEPIIDGAIV